MTVLSDQGLLDIGDAQPEYRMTGPRPDAARESFKHDGLCAKLALAGLR